MQSLIQGELIQAHFNITGSSPYAKQNQQIWLQITKNVIGTVVLPTIHKSTPARRWNFFMHLDSGQRAYELHLTVVAVIPALRQQKQT